MGKESYSTLWSGIAGTISILLAVLWILSTLLATVFDFLPVLAGASALWLPPLNFHYYEEVAVLLSSLDVVLSVTILVVALVFCKCSSLISHRSNLPILFASAVSLVFAKALDAVYSCIGFSVDETQLAGGIVPLSLISFIIDSSWLVIVIYLVVMILFVVSSFRMRNRTGVKEFYVAGVLFVVALFTELASKSFSVLDTIFPSVYLFLAVYIILPLLEGVFAAGSFIVFGVALRRIAKSEATL